MLVRFYFAHTQLCPWPIRQKGRHQRHCCSYVTTLPHVAITSFLPNLLLYKLAAKLLKRDLSRRCSSTFNLLYLFSTHSHPSQLFTASLINLFLDHLDHLYLCYFASISFSVTHFCHLSRWLTSSSAAATMRFVLLAYSFHSITDFKTSSKPIPIYSCTQRVCRHQRRINSAHFFGT